MRSKSAEAEFGCVLFHYVPDNPFRDAISPAFTGSTDTSKHSTDRDSGGTNPQVDRRLNPFGHRYGSDVTTLANEIYYGPMFLSLLQVSEI